jgi:hypothetical protein
MEGRTPQVEGPTDAGLTTTRLLLRIEPDEGTSRRRRNGLLGAGLFPRRSVRAARVPPAQPAAHANQSVTRGSRRPATRSQTTASSGTHIPLR